MRGQPYQLYCQFCAGPRVIRQSIKPKLLYFLHSATICFNDGIGVADRNVFPDTQMLSYSVESDNSRARYGRLNLTDGHGWCSRNNLTGWLQLDLGETFEICGVATQGGTRPSYQVATFKLLYSNDTAQWRWYRDTNGSKMVMLTNLIYFADIYTGMLVVSK